MNSSRILWKILLVIPFVIDMMNNVHSLPMVLLMEFIPWVISLVKSSRKCFFCFVLIILFPTVIPYSVSNFIGKIIT